MQLSASGTRYGAVWRSIKVGGEGGGTIRVVGGRGGVPLGAMREREGHTHVLVALVI